MQEVGEPSFADLAVALRCASSALALDEGQAELLVAKLNSPGVARALAEMRLTIERVNATHDLLKSLIPHEAKIRKLATRGKPMLVWDRARAMVGVL